MSVLDIKTCTNCGLSKASSEYHKRSLSPFTAELKQEIATEVRALRAQQGHTIPVRDGLGVN